VNARGIVESAEITGIEEDEVSQELRDAVRKLVGQPFDQQSADDLVSRIQGELSGAIATTRLVGGDQSDRVRVLFVVEKNNGGAGGGSNVNSRYTVERVEVQGYDESKLNQSIRDEMNKLVGEKLDQDKANEIQNRMNAQLRPRHYALRKIEKGSDRQHIVIVYVIKNVRWIPFISSPPQRVVYHSKQNFSAALTIPIPAGNANRFLVGAADDQDLLLERFAGFNLGFESTKLGTDRLGMAVRYSSYHERWQPATVLASPTSIYRERSTFDPSVTFAFDPRLRLTAGVSLSNLQMQYPEIHDASANAAVASLNFQNVWGETEDSQALEANYDFRAGNRPLDSDFIYTSHTVNARYIYTHKRNRLFLSFFWGNISGNAPLFDRYSLGDTRTLRGWNKFDVAPLGGNRVVYGSLQYGIGGPRSIHWDLDTNGRKRIGSAGVGFHVFYDTGAVGDRGSPMKVRHSVGFGFGSSDASTFFVEMGFPIRSSRVQPIIAFGFRF
jgi:hypothetical protein